MKKLYLLLILLFFTMQQLTAQTVETFESATNNLPNFTSNGKTFNLTSSLGFTVFGTTPGLGYNASNKFIQITDGAGPETLGDTGIITVATGNIKVNSLWIYLTGDSAQNPGVTSNGAPGSVTFRGKLGGVTQFTLVKNTTGANTGTALPGNGFISVNFATDGASNYTNINIDKLEIQLGANYDYFAVDNFTWVDGVALPTVTTTTATTVGAVKATMGGNVTADGGDAAVQRGIVWATTAAPTITDHKVQNGTGAGAFSGTVTGLTAGTTIHYRAYATNSAGTTYGSELTFTTNAALGTSGTSQTNIACNGGSTGAASVTASGGTTPYSYSWSPSGGTGATASSLTAATYIVTITDGESTQITRSFTISEPSALTGTPSTTPVSCFGGTNGTANIVAAGGAGGYTYSWSPSGGTAATATGLAAGTYSVTITDNNNCTKNITGIVVGGPAAALNGTASTTPVSCFGGANGTATVTPAGGTPGYTYSWSPSGGTGATASGLAAGTYSVVITDANSCSKTVNGIVVAQPIAALNGTAITTPVSCFGGSNGTATVTPTGGTPGYTYSWSPSGGTAATASGLAAGTYSVIITDANSCSKTVTGIVVGGPAAVLNGSISTTPVSCFGGTNGSATVTATGGTPGYTYSWSPSGGTAATATGLAAGTYSVTITDANSCSKTINNINVGSSTAIIANPSQVNVSCNGGTTGSATVAPTGGSGGYTYSWSPSGGTAATASNLAQGNYTVTITDSNLCPITQNFTITEPTVLVATKGTYSNPTCNGVNNGSANVIATGGTLPYTYSWAPSGGTAATSSTLGNGAYTVTVTDGKGCTATQTFTLVQPSAFAVVTSQTNVLCKGAATGTASVTVSGGTPGYTYSWSPSGGTAATASGLAAGTYIVTITDDNSCTTTRTFTITEPTNALVASAGAQTNINCFGGSTGSATVSVTGGTGSYSYSWAPSGGTAATATGLSAGNYTVTVTDDNGCQDTHVFNITQPVAALSATTASIGVSCFNGSNGFASVTVSGGTPGYTYSWAPSGGTAAIASGLAAGNYTCTITDSKGCTLVKPITISTPSQISATEVHTDVSCNGGTNGSATVTPTGGVGGYTYSWSPTGGTAATATGLSAGVYTVTIMDANTCLHTINVTISQPTVLTASTSKTDVLCNGGATGTATVNATGGAGNYTYSWSPSGGTAATATGLSAGNYNCTITDDNGCSINKPITIGEPTILSATTSQINATCVIGGQAAVTVSGGTGPYTYLWSPSGQTTATATGLAAGNHSCLITDGNGCTITKPFIISTINTLVASTSQINVLCNGTNTGSAWVVPSGAPGPFSYVWAPSGGTADTANNLMAGNYSVTITSSNGCSIVKNFTITEPSALAVTPSQTNLFCNGATTGSASVVVTGGTGSYTYSWSPSGGTAATASGLSAGNYTVTITDANLCQTTQSFIITEPTAITATISSTNVSCNGGTTGAATVTATGGTGAYTYAWSPTGGTAATATGLSAGNYSVTITDANDCAITENVTINEPTILAATTTQTDVTCIGAADGWATVMVTGGTSGYTYAWAPSGGTAATATGLSAGNYTVTITDAKGCTLTKSVNILTIPDVTAPVPNVLNLPSITSNCSILPAQIPIPTATDNCTGIINGTTTNPLTYTTVGSYVITWSYDDGHGNISTQNQTLNVTASPLNQVTFTGAAYTYSGNLNTLQVANLPAGATVAYTTTPATGTPNGAINAGIYTVTATVSPSVSTPNCSPITLTAQLTINKAAQQITFGAIPVKILGAINSFNLNATSNSGLAVTYTFVSPTSLPAATVASATGLVNLLRPGQIVITAHQVGDNNYLPATDVSQVLIVKNNDVTVTKITIGTMVYPAPAKDIKYLMACGENNPNVSVLNETNATITPSASFSISTPKPGIYTKNVTITSEDGSTTANYTITVEKPFPFFDIVRQKFNNVLLVNNNPQTNGGYEFVSYEWFKNGQSIGTGQYYSAGNSIGNTLDPTADYSVKMTTKDGKVLQTCKSKITLSKSVNAKLYPNPIQTGKTITVEADFPSEELENMQISLYSVSGQLIRTVKSSTIQTEIQLPQEETSMYIVVIETANIKKTLKVIVNK
ncbi:T9SS type A sorting domain-containing protein [uncultured Flavobacterium sp.]|uniref:T9SS type A sorting domain-containing protein n=1 Tax=uncultured Flavobacterium sp. TaxID=165435 RepID=UPI00292D65DD|nr:T9SS type A sorting domain-containing protein [uncultured Flavobacterium sp.]